MSETAEKDAAGNAGRLGAFVRLGVVAGLILVMIAVVRFTPLRDLLDPTSLRAAIAAFGPGAPIAFVIGTGLAIAVWVPGSLPTVLGPMLFGTYAAVPLNYTGSLVGAAAGFVIARSLGGDALSRLLGGRFRLYDRYSDLLARRGFETMLYLRLVPTPFAGVSYLAGLSPIRFSHYMLATALGILPMNIIITLGTGVVVESVMQGDLRPMLSVEGIVPILMLLLALQIPRFLRYGRRRWGWFGETEPGDPAAT